MLTFGFDTAVSMTSIELDLFLCPEWNIGAPFISVYADEKNSLVLFHSTVPLINHTPMQTSCDFLSTIAISFEDLTTSPTWHIVVSFAAQPDTEWVHVGEVRFLGTDSAPVSMCTTERPSSSTSEEPSLYPGEYIPCCMWLMNFIPHSLAHELFVMNVLLFLAQVQPVLQFLIPRVMYHLQLLSLCLHQVSGFTYNNLKWNLRSDLTG